MLGALAQSGVGGIAVWVWALLLGLGAPLFFIAVLRLFQPRLVPSASAGCGPRLDYVIRPEPGEWLALGREQYARALEPSSVACSPVPGWGDHRIRARGVEIAFACENDRLQVSFEGPIERAEADRLVAEILASVSSATGQALQVAPA